MSKRIKFNYAKPKWKSIDPYFIITAADSLAELLGIKVSAYESRDPNNNRHGPDILVAQGENRQEIFRMQRIGKGLCYEIEGLDRKISRRHQKTFQSRLQVIYERRLKTGK